MKNRKPLFFWDDFKQSFTERRVVFLLGIIALLLSFIPMVWDTYFNPEPTLLIKEHLANQVENKSSTWEESKEVIPFFEDQKEGFKPSYKYENDINLAGWKDLTSQGVSSKSANTLLKYRKAVGVFRNWETVFKSYGLNQEERMILKAKFIIKVQPPLQDETFLKKQIPEKKIDINLADKEELKKMKGIGNYYASKIIFHRDILGGYHSIEQVAEIRGMPDSIFKKISAHGMVSESFKYLDIQELTALELAKHPYISMKQAKRIKAYLQHHENFDNIEEFQSATLLDDEQIEKIAPYLEF